MAFALIYAKYKMLSTQLRSSEEDMITKTKALDDAEIYWLEEQAKQEGVQDLQQATVAF